MDEIHRKHNSKKEVPLIIGNGKHPICNGLIQGENVDEIIQGVEAFVPT